MKQSLGGNKNQNEKTSQNLTVNGLEKYFIPRHHRKFSPFSPQQSAPAGEAVDSEWKEGEVRGKRFIDL